MQDSRLNVVGPRALDEFGDLVVALGLGDGHDAAVTKGHGVGQQSVVCEGARNSFDLRALAGQVMHQVGRISHCYRPDAGLAVNL